jgi:hypothetical protein
MARRLRLVQGWLALRKSKVGFEPKPTNAKFEYLQ